MAINKVEIQKFLELAKMRPVFDARSPEEFSYAHFPGAINLPLFSDEERKIVGTAYKQKGREEAIKIGLDYFGGKMRKMVEDVEKLVASWPSVEEAENKTADMTTAHASSSIWGHEEKVSFPEVAPASYKPTSSAVVLVHCWRGGMRSTAIAWLLDLYGFKVYLLEGGYKKFRHYVLETFKAAFNCKILGGFTGSGKTSILNELAVKGLAVINLEALANHKGSSFGTVGPQPSQEMFENTLAIKLQDNFVHPSASKGILLEDESQRIGAVIIPQHLWERMHGAPIYFIDIPFEERLENLLLEYGKASKKDLGDAILRIQKRLGGLETKNAINFLNENNIRESFRILLNYYDKSYLKSFLKRPNIVTHNKDIPCETVDVKANALKLIQVMENKQLSF